MAKKKETPRSDLPEVTSDEVRDVLGNLTYTKLLREIQLPGDIAAAFASGRPSMFKLVTPRQLTPAECQSVCQAMMVLLETNEVLRRHARGLEERLTLVRLALRHENYLANKATLRLADIRNVANPDVETDPDFLEKYDEPSKEGPQVR